MCEQLPARNAAPDDYPWVDQFGPVPCECGHIADDSYTYSIDDEVFCLSCSADKALEVIANPKSQARFDRAAEALRLYRVHHPHTEEPDWLLLEVIAALRDIARDELRDTEEKTVTCHICHRAPCFCDEAYAAGPGRDR